MRFLLALSLLSAVLLSCGDKSAVSLSGNLSDPSVSVQDTAFGAALSGRFKLQLSLGPEAAGPSSVMLGNFSLQTEGGVPLLQVLRTESTTNFPLVVEIGSSKSATFTFSEDAVERAAVCAGPLRIIGSIMDTSKGGTEPVTSLPFVADCGPTT